jgi:quinol monooxygenase YgiN
MPTIRVIALFQAKAGHEAQLINLLSGLTEPPRAEAGCISYELLQKNDDPTSLVMVEEWAGREALGAHLKSEHLQSAQKAVAGLVAAPPDVRLYTKVA